MKKYIQFIMIGILSMCLAACQSGIPDTTDLKQVVVSFEAVRLVVEEIGGEYIDVTTLVPEGQEPHDYQPTAKDMEKLENCDVLFVNGYGMETWMDTIYESTSISKVVDLSEGIEPIELMEVEEIEEHGQYDPHIWLSLINVRKEAEIIKNALIEIDPDHEREYTDNCDQFIRNAKALYDTYEAYFNEVENKTFVTGHAAFGYLCRDFGLEQNSVEDVFAQGEPTAKQLSQLVDYCKENQIATIFSESSASPKVSQALADEIGAQVIEIDTLEDFNKKSYLERMEENLQKIYSSMSQ